MGVQDWKRIYRGLSFLYRRVLAKAYFLKLWLEGDSSALVDGPLGQEWFPGFERAKRRLQRQSPSGDLDKLFSMQSLTPWKDWGHGTSSDWGKDCKRRHHHPPPACCSKSRHRNRATFPRAAHQFCTLRHSKALPLPYPMALNGCSTTALNLPAVRWMFTITIWNLSFFFVLFLLYFFLFFFSLEEMVS